jgi:hypothetical protein
MSLAATEMKKVDRLAWMAVVGKLNCSVDIRDAILEISQLAETLEASHLGATEVRKA